MEKLKISSDESEVTLQLKDLKQMGSFIITKNQVLFLTTDDFNKMNTHQRIGLSEIMKKLIEADLENHLKKHGYEEQKSEENWWDSYSYEESGELSYLIPNYKIERFKNKVKELNAELNFYLKELKKLTEESVKIKEHVVKLKNYQDNEISKCSRIIALIRQQAVLKGYPTAKEWNDLSKIIKEDYDSIKEEEKPDLTYRDSDFGSQNEGGNPL